MADKLQVDLVAGNAAGAVADVDKFTAALVRSDATAKGLTGGADFAKNFDKEIAAVERRSLNLAFTLKQLGNATIGTKGLDGLGRAAQRAEAEVRSTYSRLRQLEAEMAKTTDPVVLKRLRNEVAAANLDLDRLQNKIDRVAAGRQAAAARRPAAKSLDARGLLGAAGAAGVPGAFEATAGLDAAAALGIGTASLAVFGALAAAGVVIVKYSQSIRADAERRLKYEEQIAAAVNKQILTGQENLRVSAEAARVAELRRVITDDINRRDVEGLREKIALSERLKQLNPSAGNVEEQDRTISDARARILQLEQQKTAAADAAFNQRNENFKKAQEQQREFERKRVESINAGRAKIDELGQATDRFFADLFARRGQANPFVAVFTEAEAAIESTRLATAALSKELQRQALEMTNANNANALFAARLDTRLQANSLRSDARGFRNAGSDRPFIDPEILKTPGGFDAFAQRKFDNQFFSGQDRLDVNVRSLISTLARERVQFERGDSPDRTVSDRLNKQLEIIRDLNPENEAQRAEADRKIIALTQGLNPADLTEAQRRAAAAARENEATRLDNAETAAKAEREDAKRVQASIDKNIAELLEIAKKEGLSGVIRIINEAEDVAKTSLGKRKRADAVDAADLMD